MSGEESPLAPGRLFSCEGQVAIVTGGASGIGAASAEALAAAGANVLVVDLPGSPATSFAARLTEHGLEAAALENDVTSADAPRQIVAAALDLWGRIDIVVCCAGVALDRPGEQLTDDELQRMFDINVASVVRLAREALPVMAESGGGSFITVSSIAGLRGNKVLSGYGVTKAANAQIARNVAVQWGASGIRSNAISPGVIDTQFARPITADESTSAARKAVTPLGRFGRVDEVAGTVVWLASPAGGFVSGQNIVVDGGTLTSD